jgi:hypothetical protein
MNMFNLKGGLARENSHLTLRRNKAKGDFLKLVFDDKIMTFLHMHYTDTVVEFTYSILQKLL